MENLNPDKWIIDRVVVWDWYDGPRQGVAHLAQPEAEIAFDLLAERHNPDGLDDRLYRVSQLPRGSVDDILKALEPLGGPVNVVWVPMWNFASQEQKNQVEQGIQRILSQQKDTGLLIHSRDMTTVLGCWDRDQVNGKAEDWFSLLQIA